MPNPSRKLPAIVMIDDYRPMSVSAPSFGDWLWLGYYVLALAALTVFVGYLIGDTLAFIGGF